MVYTRNKKIASFAGIFGAVILGFGLVLSLICLLFGLLSYTFFKQLIVLHFVFGVISLVAWGVISGVSAPEQAKKMVSGRTSRFGALALSYSVVFISIIVIGNWLIGRYDRKWDFSEEKVNSLAKQSQEILAALQKPLRLVGFKTPEQFEVLSALLDRYRSAAPRRVTVEMIDPRLKPHLVDKYEMQPGNLVYIEYGEPGDIQVSRVNNASEQEITNAVLRLSRGAAKKVYYLQGHGEPSLNDTEVAGLKGFATALEDEHYKVAELQLSTSTMVPMDAVAVIVAAPKKSLTDKEREILLSYAKQGGRLMLFHDPFAGDEVRILSERFGITVGKDVVIDRNQLLGASSLGVQPYVTEYLQHPVTKDLNTQSPTVFTIASSVKKSEASNPEEKDTTYTELVKAGPLSWGETNLQLLFGDDPSAAKEPEDATGPVALAVAYERSLAKGEVNKNLSEPDGSSKKNSSNKDGTKQSDELEFEKITRVVVFGDIDFIQNSSFSLFSNRDLVLNALNWIAGQEGVLTLPPKSIRASNALISEETFLKIFTGSFLLPELFLLFGFSVWWRRRMVSVA
jgi:ABC-type uncharacterized transport system involved in gliding motility auxiliary subunit